MATRTRRRKTPSEVFFKHAKKFVADESRAGLSRVQWTPGLGITATDGHVLILWKAQTEPNKPGCTGPDTPLQFYADGGLVDKPLDYPDIEPLMDRYRGKVEYQFHIPGDALPEWVEFHKVAVTVAKATDDTFKTIELKTAKDNSQRFSLETFKQITAGHVSYRIDHLRVKNDVEPSVPAGFSIRYNAEYMANILQLIKEMNGQIFVAGEETSSVTVKLPTDDSYPIILESLALEALLMPIRRNR